MNSIVSFPLAPLDEEEIRNTVQIALQEDIGTGDITAELVPEQQLCEANIFTRNSGCFCGIPWGSESFRQVDSAIQVDWHVSDGDSVAVNQSVASLSGRTRSLLTAERTVLNFLQLLSGTATAAALATQELKGTGTMALDTRKTIPGLRVAQKYAVRVGGAGNHRIGLYDACLIKENHISAVGGIETAVSLAKQHHPNSFVEIEIESLDQLDEATRAKPDRIMLDNFTPNQMKRAVSRVAGRVQLEASGGINLTNLKSVAATGVEFISLGSLTKAVEPLDLSMRIRRSWMP